MSTGASSGKYLKSNSSGQASWEYFPSIPDEYSWMPAMMLAAAFGCGTKMTKVTTSSSSVSVGVTEALFVYSWIYGYCNASYSISVSGGSWQGSDCLWASSFLIIIPNASGSMAGSQQGWYFGSYDGVHRYYASSGTPSCTVSFSNAQNCVYYKKFTLVG